MPEQAPLSYLKGTEVNWVWTVAYMLLPTSTINVVIAMLNKVQDLAKRVDAIIAPLYPVSWAASQEEWISVITK